MACIRRSVGNEKLYRAWTYLWNTYKDNGGLPRAVSDCSRCFARLLHHHTRRTMQLMNGLVFPTIHLNGTSKRELEEQLENAHAAVRAAQEALAQCAPHGRDYYPQGPGAVMTAIQQHVDRMKKLHDVQLELEALAEHIAFL